MRQLWSATLIGIVGLYLCTEGRLLADEQPVGPVKRIGQLAWQTDYLAAYRMAREEKKQLLIFFRDEKQPAVADSFEKRVVAPDQPDLIPLRYRMCPGVSLSPKHRYYLTAAKRVVHVDLFPSAKGEHGESSDSYTSDSEASVGEQSDKESDDSD